MNQISAIIFDLDGVVCSTDRYHCQAWRMLANRLGLPFDEKISRKLRGVSRMESLEILLGQKSPDYPAEVKRELAEEKNEIYRHFLDRLTPEDLPKDVSVTLQTLRKRGYLLAIGSSSKNTRLILKRLGLGDFFDAVADGTRIIHSKPDPEVFLLAASMLGVSPKNAVVIEDAESGVRAAIAGGFRVIGIRSEENDPASDISIKRFVNLLDIL